MTVNGEFTIQAPIPEGYNMTIKQQDEVRIIEAKKSRISADAGAKE